MAPLRLSCCFTLCCMCMSCAALVLLLLIVRGVVAGVKGVMLWVPVLR